MKVNILQLKNAPGESLPFHIQDTMEKLNYDGQVIDFEGPVEVRGEVTNEKGRFILKGVVGATIATGCVNCLELFHMRLEGKLDEVYVPSGGMSGDVVEGEPVFFDGDAINIKPEVINSLLMELPMRLVCSKDCRGLCSQCGSNLNVKQCNCEREHIDPRLAVLKKLK
ncbi:YceD family protein [Desulforamulus ruminis]|uniref:YceD family protein n=1 Tax=Desulforamulus ruminis TaxID=1564 RepID=UPI002355CDF7|nr:DUF177 domain-containing protein [Desulforamulus ruminis]